MNYEDICLLNQHYQIIVAPQFFFLKKQLIGIS